VALVGALPSARSAAFQIAGPTTRDRLDASSPITYFIADGTGRAGYRDGDRQLARWAIERWQQHAGGVLRFVPSAESSALVRVYWADAQNGQYGEMRPLEVGGKRGAAVYVRPDTDALGGDIAWRARADGLLRDTIVYLTCLHELGHALGLPHTAAFADIMYFFGFGGDIVEYFDRFRRQLRARGDIARVSALSAADIARLTTRYPRPAR
jgi:hypothetical protein